MMMADPAADLCFDQKAMTAVIALGDAITRTVRIARALIESGRLVDLSGLERGVGLFCAKALDLPPELGRAVRPRLLAFQADLDLLAGALHPP